MPVTRTSTTAVANSSTVTVGGDGGSTTQTDMQATTVTVSTGPVYEDDADGLQLLLGGEANAVGENTLAAGSLSSLVDSSGSSTLAQGSATFGAAAQSSGGATAFSSTNSFADVAGADIVVGATSTSSHTLEVDDQTFWTETSTTDVTAIDIESPAPASGATAADTAPQDDPGWPGILEGNVAILTIDAEAYGDDVLVVVDATALTVEDQFSSVTALVVTEIA